MENSNTFHKVVTNIEVPKEWEITNDWDSHLPLLWMILDKITPSFTVECGCGYGSTILLNKYCKKFVSYEINKNWFDKLLSDVPDSLYWIDDWGNMATQECDLLFVDCAPGEIRKDIISRHPNDAKVIIAHDTEPGAEYVYGMNEILSTFKYRLDYIPIGKPHTTAVSNFVDVTKFIE